MKRYVLVIDEGTTGVRAILFDSGFEIVSQHYEKLNVHYEKGGIVEESAAEIFDKVVFCGRNAIKEAGIAPDEIDCLGVTVQRVTWVFWDKETGEPVCDAVVWQDTRARDMVPVVREDPDFRRICPYFVNELRTTSICVSIPLYLKNHPDVKAQLDAGKLLFGTMETWLVWKLTKGKVFATDLSNASTLGAMDEKTQKWDMNMLGNYAGLPESIFAEPKACADDYGMTDAEFFGVEIPITGVVADQQSALFSQGCHEISTGKCTNGTGSFLTVNIGQSYPERPEGGHQGIVPRVAWKIGDTTDYMVEALCPTTGAVLEWAKDKLKLFDDIKEVDALASSVDDTDGVYFVPALTGLYSPYTDPTARASYIGISGSTRREHFIRATIESVAFAVCGAFEALQRKFALDLKEVMISGGVSKSDIVAQNMANLLNMNVVRPKSVEATALGAAQLAAIYRGWLTKDDVRAMVQKHKVFVPNDQQQKYMDNYKIWLKAVDRSSHWLDNVL